MVKKTFVLPQVTANFSYQLEDKHENMTLTIAGGREPQDKWLQALVNTYPNTKVYCADKGAKYFLGNNLIPNVVLGDADSAGADIFAKAKSLGASVTTYPPEKDDTDLQLVLKVLPQGDLIISGIWGGRFDHLYSNVFSLSSMMEKQLGTVIMADEKELMFFLKCNETVELKFKDEKNLEAISLLPLSLETKVSLTGVHWPLESNSLSMYHPYAISNVLQKNKKLNCSCYEGIVGLYCCFK